MPLDLTDLELETAARACRALAYQEQAAEVVLSVKGVPATGAGE